MLAEHAGDVVIDDHHFIDFAAPLPGEHSDGRRAATDPHALFGHAIDNGRMTRLDHDGRAAINGKLDRLAVGEIHQRVAGDAPLLLGTASQMVHTTKGEHLRAVFARGDMADGLALRAHGSCLGPEIAVGVDLHLDTAIAEDAFGHDRDHIDAIDLRRDDEGCGLVVGIGRSGTDCGYENIGLVNDLAVPIAGGLERHEPAAMRYRALQHNVRVHAYQLAILIGVPVACSRRAGPDVTHDRTRIAADLVADGGIRRINRHIRLASRRLPRTIGRRIHSYTNDYAQAMTCQA